MLNIPNKSNFRHKRHQRDSNRKKFAFHAAVG